MIATGIGTILQGINRGPVGSGYFCPLINGPAFMSASILAGKMGGLSLIFGMTMFAGACEALLSRLLVKLRALFPTEVTGTVVVMVGLEFLPLATPRFLGVDPVDPPPDIASVLVAVTALMSMAGFTLWGKGRLRLYSVVIGMAVGCAAAAVMGIWGRQQIAHILQAPLLSIPRTGGAGIAFSPALILPFAMAMVSSMLKTMGDITTCQKINDQNWARPDMKSVSRGILACGIANILSGTVGALGQSVSSSNIGVSIATGAASRRIAYTTGALLMALAFTPKLAAVFVSLPPPVIGAMQIFAASFMVVAGISIMTSRMIDSRKTFVIGFSLFMGLGVGGRADVLAHVPHWLVPLFQSHLAVATLCVLGLNLIFRIGITSRKVLELAPGVSSSDQILDFMDKQGEAWGARKAVVHKAASAMNEVLEAISLEEPRPEKLTMEVSFDEFNLDVDVRYVGLPLEIPSGAPSAKELSDHEDGQKILATHLVRQYADRVSTHVQGDQNRILLHFDH
jgi:NCS2 family nucleobase:cation symporter-2